MNKRFWRDKKVLITGYEGFLGSRLTKKLLGAGSKIIGLDILIHRKETVLRAEDYRSFRVIKGSVVDYRLLRKIFDEEGIEIVFHLAAEAIVDRCHAKPLKAFSSNICGTWNVLEASRQKGSVKAVVVASSDKAYGSHPKLPYREDFALLGRHPYDASKSCADLIAHAYSHTYGLPVVVTRCGNIFGPGEFNFSRIVPDTMRSVLTGKPILIRSDGAFTRDYIYIDDIVDAYILLAEKTQALGLGGEAFNFSSGKPISVLSLVKKICKVAHGKMNCRILDVAKYEIRDQHLSSVKARKMLGWKPSHNLEKGLRETLGWYRDYFERRAA